MSGRPLRRTVGPLGVLALALVGAVLGLYYWLFVPVPPEIPPAHGNSLVVSADGRVLATLLAREHSQPVPFERISPALVDAVVVKEDRKFFEHAGVDYRALVRAAVANLRAGRIVQGGSTITQQYVKTTFDDRSRSLTRKLKELLVARKVESSLSKEEILARYLNSIYFGRGAYGVEAAAQRYFGVAAEDLDPAQSALLAVLISAPSAKLEALRGEDDELLEQRNLLLEQMAELGYLSPGQARAAARKPLGVIRAPAEQNTRLPFVLDQVKQELVRILPPDVAYSGGLRIETSVDLRVQSAAEQAVRSALPRAGHSGQETAGAEEGIEIALAAVEPRTGFVRALVGGSDYEQSQFNLAVQGRRQPGSAFKPFVLAAALEAGMDVSESYRGVSPVRLTYSESKDGGRRVWTVHNYQQRDYGSLDLAQATINSVNTVYAQLIMDVGPERVVDVARRLGIETPLEPEPALALGGLEQGVSPLEMAAAFATLANDGYRNRPKFITRVSRVDGEVIYRAPAEEEPVLSPEIAARVTGILERVVQEGTGKAARINRPAAGKTGTSQDFRDAWFVGYTRELSAAVWMGYPEAARSMREELGSAVGGGIPASVWAEFMSRALEGSRPRQLVEEDVSVVSICPETFALATDACPFPEVIALSKTAIPEEYCDMH
ncbi:MAG: hypothetical protein Kow00129_10790 [Thermoleophilia bacterium]